MTEENFEKFLKQSAQSYNAPPARVPRDEMWSAIQAQRAAGPRVVYGGGLRSSGVSPRRFRTKVWLGAAAAAMLLVATGVGIGRWTASPASPAPQVAGTQTIEPVIVGGQERVPTSVTPDAGPSGPPSAISAAVPSLEGTRGSARTAGQRGSTGSRLTPEGGESRVATTAGQNSPAATSAYQLTTVRYLSEAEALLTSFRARNPADQQMDAQLGAWARQLLTNTRLLLDSPVGNDPHRRPLLEDLELVLVQIVQQSPGTAPQDRELIEKTLQQEHVLTRLRTAIPAGAQRGS
ncbi:MAG TPA: hypothetical protein VFK26_00050 [Gemmatimonadaceae bacterium]|nr:hypothetical protein [Gemmatimonadaceae bacterium]